METRYCTDGKGQAQPVVWIGVGRVLVTPGRRSAATPVIVRRNALADNVPHRDLHVTKGHSLFIDDVLIPVEFLVNHRSIIWDDQAREVDIYHVELAKHGVLIADGAPAESYRDDGNRWLFQNGNSGWGLPPQPPCAPVLTGGPIVDAIWRLLDRAGPRPGLPTTADPDLHLLVDGRRVDGKRYTVAFICSRAGRPMCICCAPVLTGGPIVDAIWRRLLDRAGPRPGLPTTADPDLPMAGVAARWRSSASVAASGCVQDSRSWDGHAIRAAWAWQCGRSCCGRTANSCS